MQSRPARPSIRRFQPIRSFLLGALCFAILGSVLGGCATRAVRKPIINRMDVKVDLVRQVKGFTTQPRAFEHPAIISVERLQNILNAVEVETSANSRGGTGVIRQPAFHPAIVEATATAMSEAFAEANPDQEIGVKAIRKEMQLGVFHRKYLTSFLAYLKDGYLYLLLNRVDWPIPQKAEDDPLPEPRRGYSPMKFRVIAGEHLYYAGPQTLEIEWQSPVFRKPYHLPGTTGGSKRRRSIIEQSPIPREEREAASRDADEVGIEALSPEQLRALADLEEDRREGRITEATYQRAKRQLLRKR